MMIWIKKYWFILLGSLVGVLTIAVKILTSQNSQLRRKVETVEAKVHHNKVVNEKEIEHEIEFKSRKADLVNEIEEKKTSSELSDPNKDW